MKLKNLLALLLCLGILAAAFLLPGLSLRLQTRAALRATRRQDAADTLLDTAQVDLVKKLRLLDDPEATPFTIEFDPAQRESIISTAMQELKLLGELGAVPKELGQLSELDSSIWGIDYLVFFVPETNVTADFYVLRLWDDLAEIVMDRETGKLLTLRLSSSMGGGLLLFEAGPESSQTMMNAWAEYYGLTLTGTLEGELSSALLRSRRNPSGPISSAWICIGTMADAGGSQVSFGMHYDFLSYGDSSLFWGPNADSDRR